MQRLGGQEDEAGYHTGLQNRPSPSLAAGVSCAPPCEPAGKCMREHSGRSGRLGWVVYIGLCQLKNTVFQLSRLCQGWAAVQACFRGLGQPL